MQKYDNFFFLFFFTNTSLFNAAHCHQRWAGISNEKNESLCSSLRLDSSLNGLIHCPFIQIHVV